jgi:predicted DNA-binding transcriptional regulator YafY
MDEPRPLARTLRTLELIQASPGITAERLGAALGVSERAARRYVALLREAELPVESVRGPYGGYRLGRGLRLPPLLFSPAEALALVMAVLDGHHDAADPTSPVGSALGKLVRALPESVAGSAELVRRTTSTAPDLAAARPDPATTAELVSACARGRAVLLGYRSEAGSEWVREVEPWSVVVRHGRWYLLCRVPERDAVRAYRVDRVRSVELLERAVVRPEGLDAVAALEEHLAAGWEYAAEVLIDAPLERLAGSVARGLGRLEAVDATTTRLTGTTGNPYWYAEQLARLPAPFQVAGGVELQHCVRELGDRLVAAAPVRE